MRALGCTYGQGYYFARPVGAEEIEAGMEGLATPTRWRAATGPAGKRKRRSLRAGASSA